MIGKFIKFWQKILNLPFFLLIISFFMVVTIYVVQNNTEGRVKADDLGHFCDNPPTCCDRIPKSGDAHECDWPERKYCRPDQCVIAEGNPRERCGVAYIEDWPFGCVGKPPPGVTISPNMTPVIHDSYPTSIPTVSLPITQAPVVILTPTINPTQVVQPTSIPVAPTAFSTQAPIYVVATGVPTAIPAVTSIPTPVPTVPSAASVISKQVVDFIQSAKEAISRFFSAVLP